MIYRWIELLKRLVRGTHDEPIKIDPEQFGGGRRRGIYFQDEIERLMCSRKGCHRPADQSWSGCADDNIERPLCNECDYQLNLMVMLWMGDPDVKRKSAAYKERLFGESG